MAEYSSTVTIRQFIVFLAILIACATWSRWFSTDYSIMGVHLGDSRASVLERFPQAKKVQFLTFGGEGRIADSFSKYRRCLELSPDLALALDESGRVEAIVGPQLESRGKLILNQQNLGHASDFLGEPISGSSSDATYTCYEGGVLTRSDLHGAAICIHR